MAADDGLRSLLPRPGQEPVTCVPHATCVAQKTFLFVCRNRVESLKLSFNWEHLLDCIGLLGIQMDDR